LKHVEIKVLSNTLEIGSDFDFKQCLVTLCMLAAELSAKGKAYANSLDPDQAQQNVGHDLRSKLFDSLILILQN